MNFSQIRSIKKLKMKEKLFWYLELILTRSFFHKLIAVLLLIWILFFLWQHLSIFFFVFVFAYLFWEWVTFIRKKLAHYKINIKEWYIITFLYIVFLTLIWFVLFNVIPHISKELVQFNFAEMAKNAQEAWLNQLKTFWIETGKNEINFIDSIKHKVFEQNTLEKIGKATASGLKTFLQIAIAMILSYIYLFERKKILEIASNIENTYYKDIWITYKYLWSKLRDGFGYVFKAQFIIALFNSILTTIGLFILWYVFEGEMFPMIFTMTIIVFLFWFIPVLGTIFSSIPLMIVWFSFWWTPMVLSIIIMVLVVHAFEAYYLNPKILWKFTHYPIFVSLIILYLGEHILWPSWLILWMPIFMIIVSLLKDFNIYLFSLEKRYVEQFENIEENYQDWFVLKNTINKIKRRK